MPQALRFRQNVNEDPTFTARVGLTPEQVQVSRDRGLLQPVGQTTDAGRRAVSSGGSVPAAAVRETTGVATAVRGTAGNEASAGAADSRGATSGSTPGAA
eukprot:3194157-Amphidinium_carterae.1